MIHKNPRIDLYDSPMAIIMKMSDGHPDAATVLTQLFTKGASIDPDSALGELSGMLGLDGLDIYGHRIWQFYKDVCGQDLTRMVALMRAVQLGYLNESELIGAVDGKRMPEGWAEIYAAKVRERLPAFGQMAPH